MTERENSPPPPALSVGKMLAIQAGIVVLAVLLGLVFRQDLAGQIEFDLKALNWSVLGTGLLVLMAWWLADAPWGWVRELKGFMRDLVVPLFRNAPAGTLFMVALLAGLGEELLFRGVIQGGLEGVVGSWPALILASVLFGAMHALSRAYFLIATLMGFYLGLIYLWTGNLLIPILIHFFYDWIILRHYIGSRSGSPRPS